MDIFWLNNGFDKEKFNWHGGDSVNKETDGLLEAIIGENHFKKIWWLEHALEASKKVARVKLENKTATAFLISEDILITNHHVLENQDDAECATIQFNYVSDVYDEPLAIEKWSCDPEDLFKTNKNLDYTIVRLKPNEYGEKAGNKWGFFDISKKSNVKENGRVNIIQHPKGRFKEIAFRDNQVRCIKENYIQYLTDTEYGSSGSPVLDDYFNVVALHNQRVRDPDSSGKWYRNQGFLISSIYDDIKECPELKWI